MNSVDNFVVACAFVGISTALNTIITNKESPHHPMKKYIQTAMFGGDACTSILMSHESW